MNDKVQVYIEEASKKLKEKYPEGTKITGRNLHELLDDITEFYENIPDEFWEECFFKGPLAETKDVGE